MTAQSPLELRLEQMEGERWTGAVLTDDLLPDLLRQLQDTAATARSWFGDMRPMDYTVDPATGLMTWLPGVTVCRLPAAAHRDALGFARYLSEPWPLHIDLLNESPDLGNLQSVEYQFAYSRVGLDLERLKLHHLVALVALHLVNDAADVLWRERGRLHVEFIKAAPRVRLNAGWRHLGWRAVSERLHGDELCRSRHWQAVRGAQELRARAEAWLAAWRLAQGQREEEARAIEAALAAKEEDDKQARRLAAVVSAQPRAKKATLTTRQRVTEAWQSLPEDRRDRYAVSMLAKRLSLARSTVATHLKAADLRDPSKRK